MGLGENSAAKAAKWELPESVRRIPHVSVVIPAYNQAQYLGGAIRSVLEQRYRDYEILVVDDGSTDTTPEVAQGFGPNVLCIRQENQGLAGARNTGIRHARGELVALLDSDDEWLPGYLERMVGLAEAHPEAVVYYCAVEYIGPDDQDLPQKPDAIVLPPEEMYATLLRYNFLVPSTILMRREAVEQAGLFDTDFRRLQDWELWLRMLRSGARFAGTDERLVRYRLHDSSLSTDPSGGQRAARAMVTKLFGEEDGDPATWPEDKRRAFGGMYRYHALSSLQYCGDWGAASRNLGQALRCDPTLVEDSLFFYELALGAQPLGWRGAHTGPDLKRNGKALLEAIRRALPGSFGPAAQLRKETEAAAYRALGLAAYNAGELRLSRGYLLRAVQRRPAWWLDRQVLGCMLKSFLGQAALDRLRRFRRR